MPEDDKERQEAWETLCRALERLKGSHATMAEEVAALRVWERAYWSWRRLQREYLKSLIGEAEPL